jgi:hypothetical protein
MRAGKLVALFGPLIVISVIGFVVGCGSGGQVGDTLKGEAIKEDQKGARVDAKEERKASRAAEKKEKGSMKTGHGRP